MKSKSRQFGPVCRALVVCLSFLLGETPLISRAQTRQLVDEFGALEVEAPDFDDDPRSGDSHSATSGADPSDSESQGDSGAAEFDFSKPLLTKLSSSSGKVTFAQGKSMSLTVDSRWVSFGGETPVRLHLKLASPATRDRRFHVLFRASHPQYRYEWATSVREEFELREGESQASCTLSVPCHFPWERIQTRVYEDGAPLKELSQTTWMQGQNLSESAYNILFVGSNAETRKRLGAQVQWVGATSFVGTQRGRRVVGNSGLPMGVLAVHPQDLPRRWTDYSSLDVVVIDFSQIVKLSSSAGNPLAWQAILDWTMAGGNLIITGAGAQDEHLDEISRLTLAESPKSSDPGEIWRSPDPESLVSAAESLTGFGDESEFGFRARVEVAPSVMVPAESANSGEAPPPPAKPPKAVAPFKWRLMGLGTVSAWPGSDSLEDPYQDLKAHLQIVMRQGETKWENRHGLWRLGVAEDFWNWSIPGVGEAPVGWFRFSITAFAFAIGPLSYVWLRRRGTLHRLLWIVPSSALAVTVGLFAYAILSDGLATRTRVRSYAEIDQRVGRAANFSRIAYFAGLAPSEGLSFPRDTLVLPSDEFLPEIGSSASEREVVNAGDLRRLTKGWLASRTPTQLVTLTSRATKARVDIEEDSAGVLISAINRLGSRIQVLGICDHAGKFWLAENVGEGDQANLTESTSRGIQVATQKPISDQAPHFPEGYYFGGSRGFLGLRGASRTSYRTYGYSGNQSNGAGRHKSALERGINGAWQGFQGEPNGLAPGSYVAIMDRSPELEIGLESSKEEEGLHVVHGKW